jgi:hypothetical protein
MGAEWVLVNGVPVIADGVATMALPGQVLRGPGYQAPAGKAAAGNFRAAASSAK